MHGMETKMKGKKKREKIKQILESYDLGSKRNFRENNSTQCFALECFNVSGNVSRMYQAQPVDLQAFCLL